MAELPAIACQWDGEAFVPKRQWLAVCNRAFTVGQVYTVNPEELRNMGRHKAYFAGINESWQSLPDHLLAEYPSAEHLRHKALIATGYCQQRDHVTNSKAEALRLAGFLAALDTYAVVIVSGSVVRVCQAESQSMRAMGAERFKQSAEAVERWIGDLLELNRERAAA